MISIIIPLYNKEHSVKSTILSVLQQTFQNYEILVINDGSTDLSASVVESIRDDRIRIITKVNGGVSSARNRGIREAKFDWIAFLDGDDLWEKDHLNIIYQMICEHPDHKVFATSFEYSDKRHFPRVDRSLRFSVINNYFKESLREHLIWTSVAAIHKTCFLEVGAFNENLALGEDMELWNRLMRKYLLVKSNDITAIYRIDAENRSNTGGRYKMEKSFLSVFDLNSVTGDEKKYYQSLILHKMKTFLAKKDFKNFLFLLKKYNIKLIS